MLREDLRNKLKSKLLKNPKEAVKMIEEDPAIVKLLLEEIETKENEQRIEKVRYMNITRSMDQQLRETAERMKTTQGFLIGAGVLIFLMLLGDSN